MALTATHGESEFRTGDTVRVYQRIQEDEKTRTQVFEGTLIAIKRGDGDTTFTVRRLGAGGIGIERIFPLGSPLIEKVEVAAKAAVRRAKLYYLRKKSAREVAELTKRRARKQAKKQTKTKPKKTKRKAATKKQAKRKRTRKK